MYMYGCVYVLVTFIYGPLNLTNGGWFILVDQVQRKKQNVLIILQLLYCALFFYLFLNLFTSNSMEQ